MIRRISTAMAAFLMTGAAWAADARGATAPPAASATSCLETEKSALPPDVFGFSAGSDVSDVGAWALGLEYNGAFNGAGFKTGRVAGHIGKVQVSTAFAPCWEIGPYLLGSTTTGKLDGILGNNSLNTRGGGVENKLKLLGRETHGIGLTLAFDPNYQPFRQTDTTFDPALVTSGAQYNSAYKILLDKELVAGRLWAALNLQWDQIWTERPTLIDPAGVGDYVRNSNLTISGALALQALDGLFVGGEARYVRTHNGPLFNTFTGDALYVGPTLYWQASKALSISGTWGVQVAGKAKFAQDAAVAENWLSSSLNLITQNQHVAKLKIGISF